METVGIPFLGKSTGEMSTKCVRKCFGNLLFQYFFANYSHWRNGIFYQNFGLIPPFQKYSCPRSVLRQKFALVGGFSRLEGHWSPKKKFGRHSPNVAVTYAPYVSKPSKVLPVLGAFRPSVPFLRVQQNVT